MNQRVVATINRKALLHNFAVAKTHAHGSKLVAVIKANAYGHGLLPVAETLQDADLFGVTDLAEAEILRAGGTDKDILILQGIIDRNEIARCARQGFQLVIHSPDQLHWLEAALDNISLPKPLVFWLKLDTGMHRLGIAPTDCNTICSKLLAKPWTKNVVLMTHLANASEPQSPLNAMQLQQFHTCINSHDKPPLAASIAASAALLALDCKSNWVRPGLMLYGSSPFLWRDIQRRREAFNLQAVMTLQARLIAIKDIAAGSSVGYNSQFISTTPMRIGIVSIGYADGYPSNTPNGAPVMVSGTRTTTVGRVSMDMLAIDLTHIPQALVGDVVTLWGDEISLDEVAAHTGILSYNLTCSISARVAREYI